MKINELNKRGFTLIEVMVVVLIAMILSVLAVGSYSAMKQRRNLRTAAESFNSALVTARSYAVSRNEWHRVVVQFRDPTTLTESPSYWIDEIPPGSNATPNPTVPEAAARPKVTTPQNLPTGVHFLDASIGGTTFTATATNFVIIRFFPNGSSDEFDIRMYEDSVAGNRPTPIQTVKLYGATPKSRIFGDATP
jgi:prepilin-type N-terminal cleavage/methylation domain-containing protein